MPDDSSGNYSPPAGTLVNTGDTVLPSQHNPWANDSSTAISNRFSKDGRAPATGNWNLNGFRITQLGTPSSAGDATTKTYVDTAITAVNSSQPKIENLAANRLALAADKGTSFRFSGNRTLTFQPAATLGANWWCEAWSKSGVVTLDPDSAETIEGSATMLIQTGERCIVFCTGTLFYAITASTSYSGPQLQGYYFGLALTTAADAANDITVATGSAAADTANYDLMQLTSAITKQIDAAWAVGNNAGGLDTGSVGNNTYYIWLIRRPDTGVVDVLYSLSSTAPTMPTNYTQKRLVGRLTRVSATNGPPGSLNDLNPLGLKYGTLITASTAAININSGIPSDAKRITLVSELSAATGMQVLIQLGTGGVLETSGYVGAVAVIGGGTANATPSTSFLLAVNASVAGPYYGVVTLTRQDPSLNKWILSSQLSENSGFMTFASGSKTLAGSLDRIQISSVAGSVSFSGTLGIIVERF